MKKSIQTRNMLIRSIARINVFGENIPRSIFGKKVPGSIFGEKVPGSVFGKTMSGGRMAKGDRGEKNLWRGGIWNKSLWKRGLAMLACMGMILSNQPLWAMEAMDGSDLQAEDENALQVEDENALQAEDVTQTPDSLNALSDETESGADSTMTVAVDKTDASSVSVASKGDTSTASETNKSKEETIIHEQAESTENNLVESKTNESDSPLDEDETEGQINSLNLQVDELNSEEMLSTASLAEESNAIALANVYGWFYDYWMCSSWWDFLDGFFNYGARKFVLLNDISMTDQWSFSGNYTFTVNGNGHQMINNMAKSGPMIWVSNGATLITEGNLILNGNNHRNNGATTEGGSSVVDIINATWIGTDTTVCNNLNYGYISDAGLGGGTGFNIVSENRVGYGAAGYFTNCLAFNCDGAAFFSRNTDGYGAAIYCNNCTAYDSSWGFMTQDGYMEVRNSNANANRYNPNKWMHGGAGITYFGNATGYVENTSTSGANCGIWACGNRQITYKNCTIKNSNWGVFSGNEAANSFRLEGGQVLGNTVGLLNGFFNRPYGIAEGTKFYSNQTAISNTGRLDLIKCDIYQNTTGLSIDPGAFVSSNKGSYANNSNYDVVQKGTYQLRGISSFGNKGIYLAKNCILELTGPLTCGEKNLAITLEETRPNPGRIVARCAYGKNQSTANQMLLKMNLKNAKTSTRQGNGYKSALLRAGVGSNGSAGDIIVSESYKVHYDGNIIGSHLTAKTPGDETIYWKEAATLSYKNTDYFFDGKKFSSFTLLGYSFDKDRNHLVFSPQMTYTIPANRATCDYTFYAIYDVIADLTICGNGQTSGDDYTIANASDKTFLLPGNSFEKRYERLVYDENFSEEVKEVVDYSFQGWAKRTDAKYFDGDLLPENTKIDINAWGRDLLSTDQAKINGDGKISNMILYAVWDQPPTIAAYNRYFSVEEVENGKVTAAEILKEVTADDAEDGKNVELSVELPEEDLLLSFDEIGSATAKIIAKDGAKNVTEKLIRITITAAGAYMGDFVDDNAVVYRSIDENNYKKEEEGSGGLMAESKWKEDEKLTGCLLATFKRIEDGTPEKTKVIILDL